MLIKFIVYQTNVCRFEIEGKSGTILINGRVTSQEIQVMLKEKKFPHGEVCTMIITRLYLT